MIIKVDKLPKEVVRIVSSHPIDILPEEAVVAVCSLCPVLHGPKCHIARRRGRVLVEGPKGTQYPEEYNYSQYRRMNWHGQGDDGVQENALFAREGPSSVSAKVARPSQQTRRGSHTDSLSHSCDKMKCR